MASPNERKLRKLALMKKVRELNEPAAPEPEPVVAETPVEPEPVVTKPAPVLKPVAKKAKKTFSTKKTTKAKE